MPDTRPGTRFKDGVCQACLNYDKRKEVDWEVREATLWGLCKAYKDMNREYDCVIAVSGGKDSYFLCHQMKRIGMKALLCTVTDSFKHTKVGQRNLRNLIETFKWDHWQYTINHDLFKRATRIGFETTGEALKFVEYAIYTIPVKLAQMFHIPLVIYGENSAYEYGNTPTDSYDATPYIRRMVLKIKNEKMWWMKHGLTEDEVESIMVRGYYPKVLYMSYFYPWSSLEHRDLAMSYGFHDLGNEWYREGTIENFEQIDSYGYMVHLWLKYPKFGFQRVSDVASRRVREGKLSLEDAKHLIAQEDPDLDECAMYDFCDTCGYSEKEFWQIVNRYTHTA